MLLMENLPSYWIAREKNHLILRRLSDWYRFVPTSNQFETTEEFEKAKLEDDDWATVFYVPKEQVLGDLITNILQTMPDNVIRAAPVGETNRLKITGIVFYIRQFLRLAESPMFRPEQYDAQKQRQVKFYKIERAQAGSVQQVLERIVLPVGRPRIGGVTEEANQVDMVLEPLSNTLIIKANAKWHREIETIIKQIEDAEVVAEATPHFIELKNARAGELAMLLNPLLQAQSSMRPSWKRGEIDRERVYVQAEPTSNSLIVLATKEGMKRVEPLIQQLDTASPEAMYKRIVLENARADQIFGLVNTIVQSRQVSRGHRAGGQPLQVIPDSQSNALYVMGNPKDIEYVEKLVKEVDTADVERSKAHIVKLKKARPSVVQQGLEALFGGEGRVRRGAPAGSLRMIADDNSQVLVVICPEKDWKEIDPQIRQFDTEVVSLDPVTRMLPIKDGDAEEIAQTLNNIFRGRLGRAPVTIAADRKTNMLFVTTIEPAFEEVESLIKKLDIPSKEGSLEVLPLENAQATEVANLIQQMFMDRSGRFGRGGAAGPTILPDPIANALIVRASKSDFEEIEIQAARLDDAAKVVGIKPVIIPLEYADPQQVASLCEAMFVRQSRGRQVDRMTFFLPHRTGLIVRAPAQQMKEIQEFIKSLDRPEVENVEVKTVQVPGQDVHQLALTLERVFGADRGRRGSGAMSFMPNPSADMLVITAPKKRFEEIDKVIAQYTEGAKVATANMKMFDLKNARVDDVGELLQQMLGAALQRGGRSAVFRQVQVLREPRQNKLIVFAPDEVMKQAEEMIKQLDVPVGEDAGGIKWIAMKNADAGYVASTLNAMWSERVRSGRRSFRALPVQIWPEAVTNSVLVSAPADEFKEIEKLAKELDEGVKVATTQPSIVKLEYAAPEYVVRMCQEMFVPQVPSGRGYRTSPQTESVSFTPMSSGVMIRAPQERLKPILEFIKTIDVPQQTRLEVQTFHLPGVNVEQLYQVLTTAFGRIPLKRDEPQMSFQLDAPRETIIVAADAARLPEITKLIEDFKKANVQEPSIQEMVPVQYTRASYAASQLDAMLRRQLQSRSKRLADQLQITPEDRQNKVIIFAPKDVVEVAKQILKQIDVPVEPDTTQPTGIDLAIVKWIPMEHVDATQAANTVKQIWDASLPPQRTNEYRRPIQIWGESITNSVLVAGAFGKDYQEIERIAKDIDAKAVANPNNPVLIKLEYASPSEVASMIQAMFVPPGRRAQEKVMVQVVSTGIIVRAPKIELEQIQEFIKGYDVPEASGLKIRTFYLPNTNVSELASTLSTVFGYKKRRANEPGWSFIPNTAADTLMVLAPETRFKEIEDVVKQYTDNVQKTESKMHLIDIKHVRASEVYSVLSSLLVEKIRRSFGQRTASQIQMSYEARQNKLVVFAPDEVMKQVEEMVKQIDVELVDDSEEIKWIPIEFADASEVASRVQSFSSRKQSGSKQRQNLEFRDVQVWPEMVTNSLLVSAPKKEFDEIEKLAKKIDAEYAEKGLERVKITPKYVSSSQVQTMVQQLFMTGKRRDVRTQMQQIKVIPAGQYSFFLEAPKDKLPAIQKMIAEMDTEGENTPIIKTYKMGDANVREIARALSTAMSGIGSYIPEPRRGALIVSAPKQHFDRIEKTMEELKAEIKEEEKQFEVIPLKFARPSDVYGRLSQLVSMQLGERRSRSDRSVELSLLPDDNNNRLFVHAAAEEMALVKKMLEQLDVENLRKEAELHTIACKRTDCTYMAGKISQVFTQAEQQRRAVKRGAAARDIIPIQVVPEPTTNTLLITCTEEDFRDIELFVAQMEDAFVEKEKVRELITPKFVSYSQLMATINSIYNPPLRSGTRRKEIEDIRAIPATGSSFYLEAPKDKMPELKKLIDELDVEGKDQPIVRTYKLGDAVNVSTLARMLQTTLAGKGSFYPDPQLGMIIISAPEHRFEQIEKMMQQLKADIEEVRQQFKVFPLKFAKANTISGQLAHLVQTQASTVRGRRGIGVQLSIVPDPILNRLFVYAGDEEMKLVEEMLQQFDIEGIEPETQIYEIELTNADASWAYSMVTQMFTQQELERRRRGQIGAVVQPIRVVPDTASNRLLIWASPQDFKDIEKYVKDLDERAKDSKPERRILQPKFVRVNELHSMIQALFLSPRQRTGQRTRFIETFMIVSGADLILNGPKDRLDEIEAFVKTVDTEERGKLEIKTFSLPEVDIGSLVSTLQTLYSQDARQQRGSMLFLPDPANSELMVAAPKSMMKDIEEVIAKKQEGAKKFARKLTIFEVRHVEVNYLASMLAPLVTERTRMTRGRYAQPVVTITPEARTNRLLVMAGEAETKIAEELIKELDTEAMGLKDQIHVIEMKKADASYVASTLQAMASGRSQLRKTRTYTATPVYIVAEPMTNRIFVAANEQDYKEIEALAREMDEAAELQGIQKEKIEVKYAEPHALVSTIMTMFQPLKTQGRRVESDVRLTVAGANNIIAQAPAAKMVEVKQWIKELDVQDIAESQTKFFPLDIARAAEIVGIIQPMLQTKAQEIALKQGLRAQRGAALMVLPDNRNNRVIVSGPSQLLVMAEQLIKELDVEDPTWTGETVEIVEIEKAEATQVAQVLQQILRDREGQQPLRPRKGVGGGEVSALAVTIVPDASSNTLVLKGLPRDLARVKDLIAQIEEKSVGGGVQFKLYRLKESDAEEVAQVASQMVNQTADPRSKRNPVQITGNYMMNAVFVAGTGKQQAMVQKIIDMFEKPEMELDPNTGQMVRVEERGPFEFIPLVYSKASDLKCCLLYTSPSPRDS